MNIDSNVLLSLKEIGYLEATRIQAESIPVIKEGKDLIGQSETGSGKTAAFGIPLVEKVNRSGEPQALILVPTRELCLQITEEIKKISKYKDLRVSAIYGGASIEIQTEQLKNTEIIVGTPGRVLDHFRRGNIKTDKIKFFVLDEADKMLDMGFFDDIKSIESKLPKRQTLLFSATMPENLLSITRQITKDPLKVKTDTKVKKELLEQFYYDVHKQEKFSLLFHLIKLENIGLSIIFCNTRKEAETVYINLRKQNVKALLLHGGLKQNRREEVIRKFHEGKINVLVATDVAARGLDIKNVTHIFNYSIPNNSEDYVNRIGRTARAGKSGIAISLISKEDHESFRRVLNEYNFEIKKLKTDFKKLNFYLNQKQRPYKKRFY